MAEVALIAAKKAKLNSDIKKGSKSAKTALKLANDPDKFLSTVQIGITLIGILTGIYSGETLSGEFAKILTQCGISLSIALPLAQGSIIIIVTYLSIVLGELFPKRIGMSQATSVAKIMAPVMSFLSKITYPFVWILSKSTSLLSFITGIKDTDSKVTEDEIISIIQEGTESGEVQEVEQDIMERVLVLGDQRVASIMTPRKDIVCLDVSMDPFQIKEVLTEELHDAYPVINGTLDEYCGMVSLKDLILTLQTNNFNLKSVMKTAIFFPENMTVYKALELFKEKKTNHALVIDEFGSVQGIITLHDILEGLVGSIDEPHEQPQIIERSDKKSWLIEGMCPMYDFLDYFEENDLYDSEAPYTTIGGLILDELEQIPTTGQKLEWKKFKIEIVDMDGARIDKVLVTITENNETEN